MRGIYEIERETTDGDRAIVGKVDIEGLLARQDGLEVAKAKADVALTEGAVFKVRVIHDDGWYRRTHASREAGRDWRYTKRCPPRVAAMQEP